MNKLKMLTLAVLALLGNMQIIAQTGSGMSCNDAIMVDSNFVGTIPYAGTFWFTSWSYNLPIEVKYEPVSTNCTTPPVAYIDFTCTADVYPTQELQDLFGMAGHSGYIVMPIKMDFTQVVENGRINYVLQIGSTYRDMMTMAGITQDVQAFVKGTFPEGGRVTLSPDFSFGNCMDGGKIITTGDTMQIHTNDNDHYYILPLAKWKNDSIRFVWSGTSNADIWLSYNCEFSPVGSDPDLLLHLTLAPNDTLSAKLTMAQVQYFLEQFKQYSEDAESGIYYLKITSSADGIMKFDKVPQTPPQNGAIELKIGKTTAVTDSNQLYCFSKYWTDATMFISPTTYKMEGYFANSGSFTLNNATARTFVKDNTEHVLYLTGNEMSALSTNASDNYVYMRFRCGESTTVTPQLWKNECASANTEEIRTNQKEAISARSTIVYRLRPEDISGYELAVKWEGTATMYLYVADTCSFPRGQNAPVFYYTTVASNSIVTIPATEVDTWGQYADEDGFVYLQAYSTRAADLTLMSDKPEEEDPEPMVPTTDASIVVMCVADGVKIDVTEAQTIVLYMGETAIETLQMQPGQPVVRQLQAGARYKLVGTDTVHVML